MSKCRYDVSEDCNNTDCLTCVLDKIREIVDEWQSDSWTDNLSYECMIKIAEIIDKYRGESEDT